MTLNTTEHFSSFSPPDINTDCQTYYKKVTAESRSDGVDAYPLLIIHGGPLLGHDYCLPLQKLAYDPKVSCVIFYDQIGCGKSTRLSTEEKSFINDFFNVNLAQTKSLVDDLGSRESGFYLFGHSLGSLMAETYAANYPDGLRGLVLANAIVTVPDYLQSNLQLFKTLPPEVGDTIINYEEYATGKRNETTVSMEQYLAACNTFRSKYFNRADPPSESFMKSMANIWEVMDVFTALSGGMIQFLWGGPVSEYNTIDILHKISAPTLVVKGEYDQALPLCQQPLLEKIPKVQEVTLKNTSHIIMDEDLDTVISTISNFFASL